MGKGKAGFGGMPGNMQQMMQQAQKMQENLMRVQEEAQTLTAEGSAGGGMVKVVATGGQQIESITIDAEVVNPDDIEMLQDLVCAAVNDGLSNVQTKVKEKMSEATGGLQIPGLSL
ncbi:MAG: YbaB/EbfC family nucleoid-associated protein [Bdellovibrionales bacterium]|nr:YbaB/EbfC family nucleoid-associated protein [Bdellovibrionales bacterium]